MANLSFVVVKDLTNRKCRLTGRRDVETNDPVLHNFQVHHTIGVILSVLISEKCRYRNANVRNSAFNKWANAHGEPYASSALSHLPQIQNLAQRTLIGLDLLLQYQQRIDQLLRPRGTARNINVNRDHLVHRN